MILHNSGYVTFLKRALLCLRSEKQGVDESENELLSVEREVLYQMNVAIAHGK